MTLTRFYYVYSTTTTTPRSALREAISPGAWSDNERRLIKLHPRHFPASRRGRIFPLARTARRNYRIVASPCRARAEPPRLFFLSVCPHSIKALSIPHRNHSKKRTNARTRGNVKSERTNRAQTGIDLSKRKISSWDSLDEVERWEARVCEKWRKKEREMGMCVRCVHAHARASIGHPITPALARIHGATLLPQ